MIELKYPETKHIDKFDVDVRPYLTTKEIELIVGEVLKQDDPIVREMMVDCYVLKFCANIEGVEDMDYDLLSASGLISEVKGEVDNLYDIYGFIDQSENTTQLLKQGVAALETFLVKVEKKIPKGKQLEKILQEVKANGSNERHGVDNTTEQSV